MRSRPTRSSDALEELGGLGGEVPDVFVLGGLGEVAEPFESAARLGEPERPNCAGLEHLVVAVEAVGDGIGRGGDRFGVVFGQRTEHVEGGADNVRVGVVEEASDLVDEALDGLGVVFGDGDDDVGERRAGDDALLCLFFVRPCHALDGLLADLLNGLSVFRQVRLVVGALRTGDSGDQTLGVRCDGLGVVDDDVAQDPGAHHPDATQVVFGESHDVLEVTGERLGAVLRKGDRGGPGVAGDGETVVTEAGEQALGDVDQRVGVADGQGGTDPGPTTADDRVVGVERGAQFVLVEVGRRERLEVDARKRLCGPVRHVYTSPVGLIYTWRSALPDGTDRSVAARRRRSRHGLGVWERVLGCESLSQVMQSDRERDIPRRQFIRSAVAIGGASALSACTEREQPMAGSDETATPAETDEGPGELLAPRGDPSSLPAAIHKWSQSLVLDAHGNTVPPQQQLVLGLSYEGSTPPTEAEREQVDAAFRTLETAFQWGTGGDTGATFNRGLLYLIGYAPSYFERVGAVPDGLMGPDTLLEAVGEDPEKTDGFDATVVLTSDLGSVVLAAEEALLGRKETLNGVEVEGSLDGVFSVAERRTGFAGKGIPAEKLDQEAVPETAPLSMGYKSGFQDSLPSEEGVKIEAGPFAGGTTLALSRLRLNLDEWYDNDHEERTDRMFCPAHDAEDVGEDGSALGADSGVTEDDVDNIEQHAEERGVVGHAQKVARARDEDDFAPKVLRRSEGFATDAPEHTGFNFTSVQRDLESFVEARKAMNTDEYDVDVPEGDHGIVSYVETINRGTYVIPTRERRALPEV